MNKSDRESFSENEIIRYYRYTEICLYGLCIINLGNYLPLF